MRIPQKKIIFVLFFLMSLDFSSDSIFGTFLFESGRITLFTQSLISLVTFIFLIFFGLKIPRRLDILIPFFLVLVVIISGLFYGMIINDRNNALNEAIPFLFFLSFLGFSNTKNPISIYNLEEFLKIFVYIIVFKTIIYSIAAFVYFGAPSWKVLLKQSPMLLIPLSIYLSKVKYKSTNSQSNILMILVLFGIIFAMSRMLVISVVFLLAVYFLNKRLVRILPIFMSFFFVFFFYLLIVGNTSSNVSEFMYGGDIYQGGLNYRIIQLGVIIDRFIEYPLFGVGFGYFTPGYLTYNELAKPYLLELDILNFSSKIGLIGTLIYSLAYIFLFKLINTINDFRLKRTAFALYWSLIAILVYSTGQTAHQSYIYWVYFAFVYGFIVSHIRTQNVNND